MLYAREVCEADFVTSGVPEAQCMYHTGLALSDKCMEALSEVLRFNAHDAVHAARPLQEVHAECQGHTTEDSCIAHKNYPYFLQSNRAIMDVLGIDGALCFDHQAGGYGQCGPYGDLQEL